MTDSQRRQPYTCPKCGASEWRADYYCCFSQGVVLETDARGMATVRDYRGNEASYDDSITDDEAYVCVPCGYRMELGTFTFVPALEKH